jgi:hypothetical protein
LQADIEAAFEAADMGQVEVDVDLDKGHGRIETRTVSVLRQADWLDGDRRFPGEVRFPDARAIIRVEARTEFKDRSRFDTRYYITSSACSAAALGKTIRGHWGIENTLHWTLDVAFHEEPVARAQGPRRAEHGARAQVRLQQAARRDPTQRSAEPSRQTLSAANQAAPTQKPQAA